MARRGDGIYPGSCSKNPARLRPPEGCRAGLLRGRDW
jgi:hypothetical protein